MAVNPFPSSGGQQYFLEIEASFNALRGSAALLSPADWRLVKAWRERGIPVNVVRAALENVFEKRAERGDAGRVQSLSYCQTAVDNAFEHLQELGFGDHAAPEVKSIEERLLELIDSLGDYGVRHKKAILQCGLRPDLEVEDDPSRVERNLVRLEEALAEAALSELSEGERCELIGTLEERVVSATKGLEGRLDAETLHRTRARARTRLLKEMIGHPALSLFV